jgi:threonine dehydrogenase-like Zn-dependent dehydrogenase
VLECSGSATATALALDALRPGGVLVVVGAGQGSGLDPATILLKEITVHGSFTYTDEFEEAVELLANGAIKVADLTTDFDARCALPGMRMVVRAWPADVGDPWFCETVQQIDAGVPSFGCPPVAS